jgi:hypothetical protein
MGGKHATLFPIRHLASGHQTVYEQVMPINFAPSS